MTKFPDHRAVNLDFFNSDHRPILINTRGLLCTGDLFKRSSFSFNHNWLLEDDYKEVHNNLWKFYENYTVLPKALADLASGMDNWARTKVGSLPKNIKKTRKRLDLLKEDDNYVLHKEPIEELEVSLEKLLNKEEIYWRQQSRTNWLSEGDRNITFFHKTASARRKRNWIYKLTDGFNNITSDHNQIERIVTDYYSALFNTLNPSNGDIEKIMELITPLVNRDMNDFLQPPSPRRKSKELCLILIFQRPLAQMALRLSFSKMPGRWWVTNS